MVSTKFLASIATFCCIWAPGLALRGPSGVESARKAAQVLEKLLPSILGTFLLGTLLQMSRGFQSCDPGLFSFIFSSFIAVLASTRTEKAANRFLMAMALTGVIILGVSANTIRMFYNRALVATACSVYIVCRGCTASVEVLEQVATIGDLDNILDAD